MRIIYTLIVALLLPVCLTAQSGQMNWEPVAAPRVDPPGPEINRGGCMALDTVTTYLDRATAYYRLSAGASGYVFGTGSVSTETAVHYNAPAGLARVEEVLIFFTDKVVMSTPDSLPVNVYTAASDSMPMTLVGSGKVSVTDIDTSGPGTWVPINCQPFTGQFLVSVAHGFINDTVNIISTNVLTTNGGPDGNQERRVRQYRSTASQWERAWDIWNIGGNPLDADALVIPVVCLVSCSGPPQTAFNSSPNSLAVAFTDQSTGDPAASWSWDFGDGNTSSQQNPSHTYSAPGTYNVCLVATNACGSDTTCSNVTVSCSAPTAAFTQTNNGSGNFTFTDQSTSGATINSWLWDFGDGFTSTMQNPVHQYPGPGNYLVCLTVTDVCGSDSTCFNLTISSCPTPQSAFTYVDNGNGNYSFTDGSSITGSSTFLWDFGDGNTSTTQSPTHTYAGNGTYLVCLTVTDSCGTDSSCQNVTVTSVGMEDRALAGIQVFPNPSEGQFRVAGALNTLAPVRVAILNVLGEKVYEMSVEPGSGRLDLRVDLRGLPPGIYSLDLRQEDARKVRKLILE